MTDQLAKLNSSDALVKQTDQQVIARYRAAIRKEFQTNPNIIESLPKDKRPSECKEWVLDALKNALTPENEPLFSGVVDELLQELEILRSKPDALYIVDSNTGKLVAPVTPDAIYQPPSFTDEAGIVRPAKPIVHPGISSAIALKNQEEYQDEQFVKKAMASGPLGSLAIEHSKNHDSIISIAKEFLDSKEIKCFDLTIDDVPMGNLTIGKESVNAHQSPNFAFHRFRLFGELLARKVMDLMSTNETVKFGTPIFRSNSKHQWYEVPYLIISNV